MIETREITVGYVKAVRRDQFKQHAFSRDYPVDRRLGEGAIPLPSGLFVKSYNTELPLFEGRVASESIRREIKTKGKISLLDVGCGRGDFLVDCKDIWGKKIDAFGVTAFPYHLASGDLIKEKINKAGVQIVVGDAQSLSSTLHRKKFLQEFDIITSVWTFDYLRDSLAALKGVYNSLKPGGLALINWESRDGASRPGNLYFGDSDFHKLENYLRNYGIHFVVKDDKGIKGVGIRKSRDRLTLPVSYITSPEQPLHYLMK